MTSSFPNGPSRYAVLSSSVHQVGRSQAVAVHAVPVPAHAVYGCSMSLKLFGKGQHHALSFNRLGGTAAAMQLHQFLIVVPVQKR